MMYKLLLMCFTFLSLCIPGQKASAITSIDSIGPQSQSGGRTGSNQAKNDKDDDDDDNNHDDEDDIIVNELDELDRENSPVPVFDLKDAECCVPGVTIPRQR